MKRIIFFSWQSDLPNATNRGFIQTALENAASIIASDQTVTIEPVIDRDTLGVPGSPDIAHTILSKITASDAFVADVSIVARDTKRAVPNPNVLIELGYALKALGHERVIMVFNRAFGKIEELPFDLRARRVLTYEMPEESASRSTERKALEKSVEAAIRSAVPLSVPAREEPTIPVLAALEDQSPNRLLILRRNLSGIIRAIDENKPIIHTQGGTVEDLLKAIEGTQAIVAEFSKIAEAVSAMSDADAAIEITRWFGLLYERYHPAEGFSGSYSEADFDYFNFIGHEIFVSFIAFLLREQRWSILADVLEEPIPLRYNFRSGGSGTEAWTFISHYVSLLLEEGRKRQRVLLHADILKQRHTTGGLSAIMPFEEFLAADFLLYLLGEVRPANKKSWGFAWRPWSNLYLKSTPTFIATAQRKKYAEFLLNLFQVGEVSDLRSKILAASSDLGKLFNNGFWTNPIRAELVEAIGTK
jgi:hypothetical protein